MSRATQIIQTSSATATGTPVSPVRDQRTFQAVVAGTGAVTATVEIYGSNAEPVAGAGVSGILIGTITLSGTTTATDGFATNAPWKWAWSKVTAITGTGAEVNVYLGV